jgi:hypothetical protein
VFVRCRTLRRLLSTATAGVLVDAYASGRFAEGCERAERIGLLLDDLGRSAREDDPKTAQERRVEIASALEDFASTRRSHSAGER